MFSAFRTTVSSKFHHSKDEAELASELAVVHWLKADKNEALFGMLFIVRPERSSLH